MVQEFRIKEEQLESENLKLTNEFESRINEYEDTLHKKFEENKNYQGTISTMNQ